MQIEESLMNDVALREHKALEDYCRNLENEIKNLEIQLFNILEGK
jgi:hypothetical protein